MADTLDSTIEKLLEFAKSKSFITWDEIIERLGQDFVNQDELMEPVLDKLKEINREPVETGIIGVDDVGPGDDEIEESDEDDDSMILENDDEDIAKTMLFVVNDEELEKAKKTIHKAASLDEPNTGIMFALPVSFVEGLGA